MTSLPCSPPDRGLKAPNGEPAINLAVVPDSDPALPITISSVHPNLNSIYYVDEFPAILRQWRNGPIVRRARDRARLHVPFSIRHRRRIRYCPQQLCARERSRFRRNGCGDPLACNYCGSAINYADSVCTYAEYDILDTIDLGTIGTLPLHSPWASNWKTTWKERSTLSGEINWSESREEAPTASEVNGSLSGNVLNLSIDTLAGGTGEYYVRSNSGPTSALDTASPWR